jgi:predicted amidohydrolase YtcJ
MAPRESANTGVEGPEYAVVDRYTALHLSTLAGAELNGDRRWAGSLEPRKFADIVAFGEDPVTCPVDRLLEILPRFTIVGGRTVSDADGMLR